MTAWSRRWRLRWRRSRTRRESHVQGGAPGAADPAQAEREQASKAMLAHLRTVNLGTVMTALGGSLDREDWRKWHLGDEVISITGEKFQSLTRQQGGNGAIELVMHARPGYDFTMLSCSSAREWDADVAVVAAARYAQGIAARVVSRARPSRPRREPYGSMTGHTSSERGVRALRRWRHTPEERVRRIRAALAGGDRPTAEIHFATLLQESSPSTERWLRRVIATTPTIWNAAAYPVSEDLRQEWRWRCGGTSPSRTGGDGVGDHVLAGAHLRPAARRDPLHARGRVLGGHSRAHPGLAGRDVMLGRLRPDGGCRSTRHARRGGTGR